MTSLNEVINVNTFIIYGPTFEASDALFDDVKNVSSVIYLQYPIKNKFLYFLQRIHLNRLKFLPGKSIWKYLYIDKDIRDAYYVYCNPWSKFMYESGYISALKKKKPNSLHVAYLTDINSARDLPLVQMKCVYDKIFIFDKDFAATNDISFYPLVYSKKSYEKNDYEELSDLVFIGQAKGRTKTIIEVYNRMTELGLLCNFWIIGAAKGEQQNGDGIHFIDNPMKPQESIMHLINAKCVLELMSEGVDALSDRVIKAVVYNKKILTNNHKIKKFEYFNPQKIKVFNSLNDIQRDFFESDNADYGYSGDYSPIKFLHYIENNIVRRDVQK